jgi:Rod binding domain-containing protein
MEGTTKISSPAHHSAAAALNDPSPQHKKLVQQSQKLVSQTFYGTLLKQIHDSPFKSKLFDGGRGGEAFSSMLDQHLADRMARGTGKKLVNSMVKHIERSNQAKQESNDAKKVARHAALLRSGYMKRPGKDRRQNVSTDYRA